MPKYKGAYKELLNEEETPQVEEVAAAPEQQQEEETGKRYGDLRRHMQDSLKRKIKNLRKSKHSLTTPQRPKLSFPSQKMKWPSGLRSTRM